MFNRHSNPTKMVSCWIVLPMIVLCCMLCSPANSTGVTPASGSGSYYGGLLTPTADPAPCTSLGVYLLTFPVGGVGQASFPATRWLTASLYGGVSGYPAGFIGSAYLRAHILRPDTNHWGLAAQAQSGIASVFSGGEGDGGFINAVALIISSPMKPTRVNIGAALHTMPGSEIRPGGRTRRTMISRTRSRRSSYRADTRSEEAQYPPNCCMLLPGLTMVGIRSSQGFWEGNFPLVEQNSRHLQAYWCKNPALLTLAICRFHP